MTLLIPGVIWCQSEMRFKKIITSTQGDEEVKTVDGHIYVEDNQVGLTVFTPSSSKKFDLNIVQNIDNQIFVYESFKNNIEYQITINFKINTTQISQIKDGEVVAKEIYPWSLMCMYIKN